MNVKLNVILLGHPVPRDKEKVTKLSCGVGDIILSELIVTFLDSSRDIVLTFRSRLPEGHFDIFDLQTLTEFDLSLPKRLPAIGRR